VIDPDVLERVLVESVTADAEPDPVRRALLLAHREARQADDTREAAKLFGLDNRARMQIQRRALMRAARLLQPSGPLGWRAAVLLSDAIKQFKRSAWPMCQAGVWPTGPVHQCLATAFLAGKPPETAEGLQRLLDLKSRRDI
jgi:hypothetical protein